MNFNRRDMAMNRREWLKRAAALTGGAVIGAAPLASLAAGMASSGIDRCVDCGRCMPCRYGVDIPGVFAFHRKASDRGIADVGHARQYLDAMDREVGHRHAAHRCISCWHCVGSCPMGIFIVGEMKSITELTDKMREALCHE